jgi:hypothetical protein
MWVYYDGLLALGIYLAQLGRKKAAARHMFETNERVSTEVIENKLIKGVARLEGFEPPTLSSGG